jgi:hypothetical protein
MPAGVATQHRARFSYENRSSGVLEPRMTMIGFRSTARPAIMAGRANLRQRSANFLSFRRAGAMI